MNLFLIRHGEAADKKAGQSDSERSLTEEGSKVLNSAAKNWKEFIPHFDYLVSSELKRAIQTAEIIRNVYNIKEKVHVDKRLNPGSNTEDIIDIANELSGENIALFGHEPDFSEHTSLFISSAGANVEFKKGAIAKITFHSKARIGAGVLQFLIPPKVFMKK